MSDQPMIPPDVQAVLREVAKLPAKWRAEARRPTLIHHDHCVEDVCAAELEAALASAPSTAGTETPAPATLPKNWQALIDLIRDESLESFVLTPAVLVALRRTLKEHQ